eukprot:1311450-Pleurochrysis_carterae.AAC.2
MGWSSDGVGSGRTWAMISREQGSGEGGRFERADPVGARFDQTSSDQKMVALGADILLVPRRETSS